MSRQNVEIVRSIFAAWERGDYSSVEWAHPEIGGLSPTARHPEAGPGWRRWQRCGAKR
jgi:ketosteroid isomerase-like protein